MGILDGLKGLLNGGKKGLGFDNLHAETDTKKFAGLDKNDVTGYVLKVVGGDYNFLILTLKEPVQNCNLIHIKKDGNDGDVSMEISIANEETGKNKLFSMFGLKPEAAMDIITAIAEKGSLPKLDDWIEVGEFGDPRELWNKAK